MPANSKRGLEHAVDFCEVCALIAHQKAEAVACVCGSWNETRNDQTSLTRVITGDKNLGLLL
jgi:hypothetical protein